MPLPTRRYFLGSATAASMAGLAGAQSQQLLTPSSSSDEPAPPVMVWRHDKRVEDMLHRQITDSTNPNAGGYPDATEIVTGQSASGVIAVLSAAFANRASRFHQSAALPERIRLAAAFLEKKQLPSGNVDLHTTNFDSPPDTGFVVHNVAPAAILLRRAGHPELAGSLDPFLRKAGRAMAVGGVHTPNHRWVVCAALALCNHLEPDGEYTRRIDQWLAEGIDIDEDGLYTERSPLVYSPVVNRSLIYMAEFLNRPSLLDPVRKNLQAALWLMHPNGELVTELSGRQDQNTTGSMGVNWLALQYMAEKDANPIYAGLARRYEGDFGDLSQWMLLPILQRRNAPAADAPASYRKFFRGAALHRFCDGKLSVSIFASGNDRFFTIRNGDAVVNAVRFASAFFGKGQFLPDSARQEGPRLTLSQSLSGPYYQPLQPPIEIPSDPDVWAESRKRRSQSEVAELVQRCTIVETTAGYELQVAIEGTPHVPVAVEINVRDGVVIEGVRTAPQSAEAFLSTGRPIVLRAGSEQLRVEAPESAHGYTQLRGALAKLPGRSVYVTGFTPFRESLRFGF